MKFAWRTLIICALLTLEQGCASIIQHETDGTRTGIDPRFSTYTPVFPGFSTDIRNIGEGLAVPFRCWYSDDVEWVAFFVMPLDLIDSVPSLLLDVGYLPGDVLFWRKHRDERISLEE